MYRAGVEALLAVVVLGAVLVGILLVLAFDVFCLMHLGTAESVRFLPKFVWAVLIVCVSPVGGVVYLVAQRGDGRSAGLLSMPTRHLLGRGWSGAGPRR
jgi:Phospholipase_D-nuclease N-terminal